MEKYLTYTVGLGYLPDPAHDQAFGSKDLNFD